MKKYQFFDFDKELSKKESCGQIVIFRDKVTVCDKEVKHECRSFY